MRRVGTYSLSILSCAMVSSWAHAQPSASHKADDDVIVPYHKHRDTRFGHDHAYPDRGAIVREIPKESAVVSYAGTAYRFHDGIWYEPRGPAFMVVAPPIGLIVPSLPSFSTVLAQRGKTVLYADDVFYQPRPDVGGYEVVNDPSSPSEEPKGDAEDAAAQPSASTTAAAAPALSVKNFDSGVAAASDAAPGAVPAVSVAPLPVSASTVATPIAAGASLAAAGASQSPSTEGAAEATPANKAYVYPRNGQSADQQARDRYECYRFGVAQSGFDPMRPAGTAVGIKPGAQADFERAQGVCLDAKGYAIR